MGLFDDIRSACRTVAERATFVRIDHSRIGPYARSIPLDLVASPSLDPAHHYVGAPDRTLAYVLSIDAINFGSGYFPHLAKRPGLSGYRTVATSLKEWFERRGDVNSADLIDLTPDSCADIFGQTTTVTETSRDRKGADARPIEELMSLFARALNDLGRFITDRYGGDFAGVVEEAGHSAESLVGLLRQMPLYRDVHPYGGLTVPFYKRAQITAADLSVALGNHQWGRFDDVAGLTAFADNLVPHVLRVDGLLHYEPDLLARINRHELIGAGSPEEIEIRACGLTAVERLAGEMRGGGAAVIPRDLDYFLWNRGQQPYYKSQPRHRTRCVYY